jgi:hypothetical protein
VGKWGFRETRELVFGNGVAGADEWPPTPKSGIFLSPSPFHPILLEREGRWRHPSRWRWGRWGM